MENSIVLDCTLRDGGYCNNWKFGRTNIQKIISGLIKSGVEIVECGFLTEKIKHDESLTQFNCLEDIEQILPSRRGNTCFVCMINYGSYDVTKLPVCDHTCINGIRVAFHKKDLKDAIQTCKIIKDKGYKVFIQPMLSMKYSDVEFIELISLCNQLSPYAFYIVDSFGTMKSKDLTRFFYLAENNLDSEILLGFHSHNNMQLAYSNAQELLRFDTSHKIVIDSSILGMGRGAGNLNTELFLGYLNENYGHAYKLSPLLDVIDEVLNDFYEKNYWGYSLTNYLSASYNAHPSYAIYFDSKKTLTVSAINDLFCMMDEDRKAEYDKDYAEQLYIQYMSQNKKETDVYELLRKELRHKMVLIIAPGKSIDIEKEKILNFVKSNEVIVIDVNFECDYLKPDYIFVSNLRRFKELNIKKNQKYIFTSNIIDFEAGYEVNYSDLLIPIESIEDNAGMMVLKLLNKLEVDHVYIAGIDGYSSNMKDNFALENMMISAKEEYIDRVNLGMKTYLNELQKKMDITFITSTRIIV